MSKFVENVEDLLKNYWNHLVDFENQDEDEVQSSLEVRMMEATLQSMREMERRVVGLIPCHNLPPFVESVGADCGAVNCPRCKRLAELDE